jgi:predicted nucleotidyltransferase
MSFGQDRYLVEIIRIIQEAMRGAACRVYLFGSRATGGHRVASDYDIAVEATREVRLRLALARYMLEESTIPFVVDLVDLTIAPERLRHRVRQQGILLWNN